MQISIFIDFYTDGSLTPIKPNLGDSILIRNAPFASWLQQKAVDALWERIEVDKRLSFSKYSLTSYIRHGR